MAVVGIEAKIADALFAHVRDLVLSPALPISWPGLPFTAPPSGAYLRCDYLPNRPRPAIVSTNAKVIWQGLLQVSVFWPASPAVGVIAGLEIRSAVLAHFKQGTVARRNGVVVKVIEHPWPSAAIEAPDRLQLPATIPWICIAA